MAPGGYTMLDADSSQIEARVLAWLAGQDNITTAFANKEDVYSIMAATIYSKVLEDVIGSERFIGKQTVLGCISEGTPVLCKSGWKPIEVVTTDDRVWDGVEWVCHQGLLKKGLKETVNLCGSWLTPDHKLLCGTQWKETASVVQDANTLSQALGTGVANLPSQATSVEYEGVLEHLLSSAHVAAASILLTSTTSKPSKVPAATYAQRSPRTILGRCIGAMQQCYLMTTTGLGYLTGYAQLSQGAIPRQAQRANTMVGGASTFVRTGGTIEGRSSPTPRRWQVGITPFLKWIGWTTKKGTNWGTSSSAREKKTWQTDEVSVSYSKKLMTYDLAYAGPRNRFTIGTNRGPVIAHNCGYGMGAERFQAQLASMGTYLELGECRRIVNAYRDANRKIKALWAQAGAVLAGMINGEAKPLGREGVLGVDSESRAIQLPNGLLMKYNELEYADSDKGAQYTYKTRKGRTRIYGGKVVENICQALARIIIAEQMLRINKRYPVKMTVHDSLPTVVPDAEVEGACVFITEQMCWAPDWAEGLSLDCEIDIGKNYGEVTQWKA